jgi:hypothetical protein
MKSCDCGVDWGIIPVDGSYSRQRSILKGRVFRKMSRDGKRSLAWGIILLVLFLGANLLSLRNGLLCFFGLGVDFSIALGIPIGAVDGNVCRVFSRVFLISTDLTKKEGKNLIWYVDSLEMD